LDEVEDLGQGGVGEGGEFLDEAFSGGHGFRGGRSRVLPVFWRAEIAVVGR
jgi:hypothetical protein